MPESTEPPDGAEVERAKLISSGSYPSHRVRDPLTQLDGSVTSCFSHRDHRTKAMNRFETSVGADAGLSAVVDLDGVGIDLDVQSETRADVATGGTASLSARDTEHGTLRRRRRERTVRRTERHRRGHRRDRSRERVHARLPLLRGRRTHRRRRGAGTADRRGHRNRRGLDRRTHQRRRTRSELSY